MEAREEEDVQGRPDDKHSRKIYTRCESAGVMFVELLVIGVSGKVSLPNAPAGLGGSKSKSNTSVHVRCNGGTYRFGFH